MDGSNGKIIEEIMSEDVNMKVNYKSYRIERERARESEREGGRERESERGSERKRE